jgi:hypothetical protein
LIKVAILGEAADRISRCDELRSTHGDGVMNMKYKLLIIAGALGVTGAAVGGGLYLAFPVQVSTIAD